MKKDGRKLWIERLSFVEGSSHFALNRRAAPGYPAEAWRRLCICLVLLPAVINGCSSKPADEPGRVRDEATGFSIVPPAGWTLTEAGKSRGVPVLYELPGPGGTVAAYLGGRVYDYSGADYAEVVERIRSDLDMKVVEQNAFAFDAGEGYMAVMEKRKNGRRDISVNYFLRDPGKGKVATVLCQTDSEQFASLRSVFDQSAKTARLD